MVGCADEVVTGGLVESGSVIRAGLTMMGVGLMSRAASCLR